MPRSSSDIAPDGDAESLTVNASAGGATGITVSTAYDSTDHEIILDRPDTKAHYEAVLESVTYKNTSTAAELHDPRTSPSW